MKENSNLKTPLKTEEVCNSHVSLSYFKCVTNCHKQSETCEKSHLSNLSQIIVKINTAQNKNL